MQQAITDSELILNPDGSIYHLGLMPEHIAPLIITVGDPARVDTVSSHFDEITFRQHRREFKSHVGRFAERPIMCISTGIGTDNVDIVLNEIDALVNIDLAKRLPKSTFTQLTFLRLGTSGTFQQDIPVDTILKSTAAIGLDGLGPHYDFKSTSLLEAFAKTYPSQSGSSYSAVADDQLLSAFAKTDIVEGITLTCAGFYGPQRRSLRLPFKGPSLSELANFSFGESRLTNFEMETAGIYALGNALGHRALSVSAILANRATGTFSDRPGEMVNQLITTAFNLISKDPKAWYA